MLRLLTKEEEEEGEKQILIMCNDCIDGMHFGRDKLDLWLETLTLDLFGSWSRELGGLAKTTRNCHPWNCPPPHHRLYTQASRRRWVQGFRSVDSLACITQPARCGASLLICHDIILQGEQQKCWEIFFPIVEEIYWKGIHGDMQGFCK